MKVVPGFEKMNQGSQMFLFSRNYQEGNLGKYKEVIPLLRDGKMVDAAKKIKTIADARSECLKKRILLEVEYLSKGTK